MAQITAVIIDKVGLHARPASALTKEASKYVSDIKIIFGGKEGNLKSIMNIMALAIKSGAEITIEATGDDADNAIAGIKAIMIEQALIQG